MSRVEEISSLQRNVIIVSTDNLSDAADEASSRRQRLTGGDNLCSSEQFRVIRTNPLLCDCLLELPMLFNLSTFLRERMMQRHSMFNLFAWLCWLIFCIGSSVFFPWLICVLQGFHLWCLSFSWNPKE